MRQKISKSAFEGLLSLQQADVAHARSQTPSPQSILEEEALVRAKEQAVTLELARAITGVTNPADAQSVPCAGQDYQLSTYSQKILLQHRPNAQALPLSTLSKAPDVIMRTLSEAGGRALLKRTFNKMGGQHAVVVASLVSVEQVGPEMPAGFVCETQVSALNRLSRQASQYSTYYTDADCQLLVAHIFRSDAGFAVVRAKPKQARQTPLFYIVPHLPVQGPKI